MAPHVDRHIDLKHSTTHDINAKDEILLTSNPSRDQQVVRKAYADSLGASGTWKPASIWRFHPVDFHQPDYGTLLGNSSKVGTTQFTLYLRAGGTKGYAKVSWRVGIGSIGREVSNERLITVLDGVGLTDAPDGKGSGFIGAFIGSRKFPTIGSDYLPSLGSSCYGFAVRSNTIWGIVTRLDGARIKKAIGSLSSAVNSVIGIETKVIVEAGSFGARWKVHYYHIGSKYWVTKTGSTSTQPDPGFAAHLHYFALSRSTGAQRELYVNYGAIEQSAIGTFTPGG